MQYMSPHIPSVNDLTLSCFILPNCSDTYVTTGLIFVQYKLPYLCSHFLYPHQSPCFLYFQRPRHLLKAEPLG